MKQIFVALIFTGVAHAACPPRFSFEYVDRVNGFSLCLPTGPEGPTKTTMEGNPAGFVLFTGLTVCDMGLTIVPCEYEFSKSTSKLGDFDANGAMFERTKYEITGLGHLTFHILYTWNGSKSLHLDFEFHSRNVNNLDSSSRPAEYDRAAQIKITERIMNTFRTLD